MILVMVLACEESSGRGQGPDQDGDGFTSLEDCDDRDATVYPAAQEIPGDAIDQDCSGTDDAVGTSLVELAATWSSPTPYASAGRRLSSGDLDGDGRDELVVAGPGPIGCDFETVGDGCGTRATFGHIWILAWEGDHWAERTAWEGPDHFREAIGQFVDARGDVNGDGKHDVLLGSNEDSRLFLGPGPWTDLEVFDNVWDSFLSLQATVPDDDGDGADSIWLGGSDPYGSYLFVHRQWWEGGGPVEEGADLLLLGTLGEEITHTLPASLDLDGDGTPEWLIGAPGHDDDAGAALVVPGGLTGTLPIEEAATRWDRARAGAEAGFSVANAGDVDGDGREEGLVGAPLDDGSAKSAGRVYLVASVPFAETSLEQAPASVEGELSYDWLGWSLTGPADVDGDGYADLLLGAPGDFLSSPGLPGKVHLLHGPLSGMLSAADADQTWVGEEFGGSAGSGLTLGDFDGDGLTDLAVGAPRVTTDAGEHAGAVYVLFAVGD